MSKCKGTYWRYWDNVFVDNQGNLQRKQSIKMLKRMSCNHDCQPSSTPCEQDYLEELFVEHVDITDRLPELPKNIRNGDTLKLNIHCYLDEFELWFEKAVSDDF